jgi:hypothetical protein
MMSSFLRDAPATLSATVPRNHRVRSLGFLPAIR